MLTKLKQAKIITPQELKNMPKLLPESWTKAAGLLKRKKGSLERHLKTVRKEWNSRFK
ncbi:MAG: hypothetical protein AAB722_00305 [Patescibacteria group bacterium]